MKQAVDLKKSKERYVEGFAGRKGKRKCHDYILIQKEKRSNLKNKESLRKVHSLEKFNDI